MLELSDPVILANIHLHIFSKMYLAERMKERSTLSIFSSFWYASWVGFLTWKKAKQFEPTHPTENFISETQLKLPDAPAADTHHQPPYPPLSTPLLPLTYTTLQINTYIHTQARLSHLHAFAHTLPSTWNTLPHISAWLNVTYSLKLLSLPPKGFPQFSLSICHQCTTPYQSCCSLFSELPKTWCLYTDICYCLFCRCIYV